VLVIGLYGYYFKVSRFFTLADKDSPIYKFVNMGSEGGNVSFYELPIGFSETEVISIVVPT
jgi:hypothetical protein